MNRYYLWDTCKTSGNRQYLGEMCWWKRVWNLQRLELLVHRSLSHRLLRRRTLGWHTWSGLTKILPILSKLWQAMPSRNILQRIRYKRREGGKKRVQKFNNGRSFISEFGNLHFLLLTQIRIARILHPVPKSGTSLSLLHIHRAVCHRADTEQAWEGQRMRRLKPLLLFSLLFPSSLCWLMSEETPVYWAVLFFFFFFSFTYCQPTQLLIQLHEIKARHQNMKLQK